MSIFSKLFPGGAKGDDDAASGAGSVDGPEEAPTMKRPTNEAKPPAATKPDGSAQKPLAPSMPRGSGVRPQAGVSAPRQAVPPRGALPVPSVPTYAVRPPVDSTSGRSPVASGSSGRGRSSSPPRAAREESIPAVGRTPSVNPGSPGSYVAVSASRLNGSTPPNAPPAAKAVEHAAAVHRSRPEMPSLSIGASLETTPAAAASSDPLPQDDARAPLPTPANIAGGPGRASAKPTPLDPERSNGASIADTFERLLSSDLDAGFASMQLPAGAPAARAAVGVDLGEVRALFAQLAANHVRAVRDFVIDLRWSDATAEWVTICAPALQSLRRAAEKLELGDLCRALDKFSDALSAAPTAPGQTIGGERRAAILACYDDLSNLMPQAFALDMDQTQRESIILQSLLLQVPDVKKVTLDKMYAAGLSTLEAMLLATPADIVATTGVAEATAQRIVERFRTYRAHVKATAPDAARTRERQHIADLASRLRREHDAYERACQHWSREAADQKRELRKVRAQTLLDIQVELARLGEVDRLTQIERLPFEGKLIELESFLEDAREKYVAQP